MHFIHEEKHVPMRTNPKLQEFKALASYDNAGLLISIVCIEMIYIHTDYISACSWLSNSQ